MEGLKGSFSKEESITGGALSELQGYKSPPGRHLPRSNFPSPSVPWTKGASNLPPKVMDS